MNRLVSILAQTPYFYIVSRGLLADKYELAANMWGEAYLPQTSILPLVSYVIQDASKVLGVYQML